MKPDINPVCATCSEDCKQAANVKIVFCQKYKKKEVEK